MELIDHVRRFVSGNVEIATTLFSLIKLEFQLAGLSVYPLLLNITMILVILMTLWIFGMFLIQYVLWQLIGSLTWSIVFILFVNLIVFAILLKQLSSNLQKMSFEKTRKFFALDKRQT